MTHTVTRKDVIEAIHSSKLNNMMGGFYLQRREAEQLLKAIEDMGLVLMPREATPEVVAEMSGVDDDSYYCTEPSKSYSNAVEAFQAQLNKPGEDNGR